MAFVTVWGEVGKEKKKNYYRGGGEKKKTKQFNLLMNFQSLRVNWHGNLESLGSRSRKENLYSPNTSFSPIALKKKWE